MLAFAGIVLGILLLVAGGTLLVRGASQLAARFGVSSMVIGLTLVAFGTSMPELVVNVVSAFRGQTDLAFGNIVGSNVANLALVMGAAALFRPLVLNSGLVQREVPLLLLGTTVLAVLALDGLLEGLPPRIGRADALVLLLIFSVFIYATILDILRSKRADALVREIEDSPLVVSHPRKRFAFLSVAGGVLLLYAGGELTVRSSVELSALLKLPMAQVGLFIVAVGTSMPELVTSVIAAIRKESDLAIGNLIGSNIFNALLVLPVTSLVSAIEIPPGGVTDLVFSWLLAAFLIPIFVVSKASFGRVAGIVVLAAYLLWILYRVF